MRTARIVCLIVAVLAAVGAVALFFQGSVLSIIFGGLLLVVALFFGVAVKALKGINSPQDLAQRHSALTEKTGRPVDPESLR